MIEIRILGPPEVVVDGGAVPLGGSKQAALVALLASHPGQTVGQARLVEALWPDGPPASESAALQPYVSRLRRILAADDHVTVERIGAGYRLTAPADRIDVARFTDLIDRARGALASGDAATAHSAADAALAMWRGRPLEGLDDRPVLVGVAAALTESRLAAVVLRAEATMALGAPDRVLLDLEGAMADHPLHEGLLWWRMLALYRTGRHTDALAAFEEHRRRLADELGLDPGPEVRLLERRILQHDATLDDRPPADQHDGRPGASLAVTGGGTVVALTGDRFVIGHDPASDLVLADPTVSRQHAVLDRLPAGWAIRDLGSRNGTLVNGEAIVAERALRPGDEIVLGDTTVEYRAVGGDAVTLTAAARPPADG